MESILEDFSSLCSGEFSRADQLSTFRGSKLGNVTGFAVEPEAETFRLRLNA